MMTVKSFIVGLSLLCCFTRHLYADALTDGTLGPRELLNSIDFKIPEAFLHPEKQKPNGGNLTITHPHLFIMDQYSKLSAQAYFGNGGHIKIDADNFINPIPENVTATSEKSIDGTVTINAFQPNLAGLLTIPLQNYLRLGLLKRTWWCGQQNRYKKTPTNSFIIRLQEMLEPSPSGLRFYSPVLEEE